MKKIIIFFLLLLSAWSLNAQKPNLDSLWTIWQDETRPDSNRVAAYKDYVRNGYLYSKPDSAALLAEALHAYAKAQQYSKASATGYDLQGAANLLQGNYPRALEFYEKAIKIWEETGNKRGIGNSLNNIGNIYWYQGNYPAALEYYEKSLKPFEEIGDKRSIATSLNNIGLIYRKQYNYPRALEYYENSLKIREETGDKVGIAASLNNFGIVYEVQGNYPRALEYYEKALKIREETGDKDGIAASLGSIGGIYSDQGNYPRALEYYEKTLNIFEEIGDKRAIAGSLINIGLIYSDQANYPRALEYYEKSLKILEEIGDKDGIATSLINIGIIYRNQGNYPGALEYFERSLKTFEEIGDKRTMAASLNNIGSVYQEQGNYPQALNYCKRGLALAEEIGVLPEQKNACQCLYDTYKAMGKGNEALVYLEKMRVVEDSLQAEETAKKLEQMEFAKVMYQDSLAKAEEARLVQEAHQAEVRKKNQTRNMLLGAGAFMFLLAGGFYSRWRYVRKSRDIISKERDRSENLLLNILPAEIAEELKEKGRADARDFDMVSILFTDFKEFTQTSEKLSAQELVGEINVCFEAFDAICGKYGIEKIKTIGDAYMAAGGLPVPDEAAAKDTVMAALEMQQFMVERRLNLEKEGKLGFQMRAGIHTGPVVAGIVGVKKFQYDIWGDTVNTASRMESHGEVGKVNISQDTYELLKDDPRFQFEPRGKIAAKGKGEVEMYFVSGNLTGE